jgi:Flp pilus assembly protein TadG
MDPMTRTRTHHRGQTLPLFALMLPALLLLMALGLDGAQMFLERRDAQGAADLAALSGVKGLPENPSKAESDACHIANENGYDCSYIDGAVVSDTVTVTTPYDGDASRIEVVIDSGVDTFFMSVLGMFDSRDHSTADVGARAVARIELGTGYGDAIFAAEPDCDTDPLSVLSWPANGVIINGGIHSNGGILVSGNNNAGNGGTTYTCSGDSDFSDPGTENVFDPAPGSTGTVSDWPESFYMWDATEPDDFTCTFSDSTSGEWNLGQGEGLAWWVGGKWNGNDPPTLIDGTYCAPNGSIKLDANNVVGKVTFVAANGVTISGQNLTLEPYENGVLIFALGSGTAISVNTEAGTWEGLIIAPNGTASVRGQSGTQLYGGIHAWNVTLDGNGFTITNDVESGGPPDLALVE